MDFDLEVVIKEEERRSLSAVSSESIRKLKIRDKDVFFQIILKKIIIMISADIKDNEKKEIKRSGSCHVF